MPTPRLFLLQVGQELSPDNPKTFRVSTTGRHQDMVLYQGELWFTAKYFVEMYAWKVSGWSNAFMRDKWQTSEEWLAIRSGALVYPFFRRWFILPNAGGWLCSNTVYRIGGREVFVAASWNCFQFWSPCIFCYCKLGKPEPFKSQSTGFLFCFFSLKELTDLAYLPGCR